MCQNYNKAGHKGETLKNDLWAVARSTNVPKYNENLQKLKEDSFDAYKWTENHPLNCWIKAFFNDFPKCDILLNNMCEVFNRSVWFP